MLRPSSISRWRSAVAQVPAYEDGPLSPAELQHGLVGGVGGVAGEAAQDGLGRGGPDPDGGGELDHLVVVLRAAIR